MYTYEKYLAIDDYVFVKDLCVLYENVITTKHNRYKIFYCKNTIDICYYNYNKLRLTAVVNINIIDNSNKTQKRKILKYLENIIKN